MNKKYQILGRLLSICLVTFGASAEVVTSLLEPCQTLGGDSHLIIAINESLGNDFSQIPEPKELSLQGQVGSDINLEISEDVSGLFALEGKDIRLKRPLDRDENDLSSLSLKITCISLVDGKRRTIPLVVRVLDLNDNAPKLKGTPYMTEIPENTPVGSVIFSNLSSMDIDANINGQVEYTLANNEESKAYFLIESPYQGIITLAKPLDYETYQRHFLEILASDRAENPKDRLSATTTLTIKVTDSDDQPPIFSQPEGYFAEVISNYPVSNLHIAPEKIHAQDQDTLRTTVFYSFVDGEPKEYDSYFSIDPETGVITQKEVIDRKLYQVFDIRVRASESTGLYYSDAPLTIRIVAEDKSPPSITSSSSIGYVEEGVEIGTYVTDSNGERIYFNVTDSDINDQEESLSLDLYDIEMTTDFFKVDGDGYLIVKEGNMDRDPPFQPMINFQIFVRERFEPFKSSDPLQLKVHLRDINDNPPIFSPISDVSLIAGSDRRFVAQINATDKDSDKYIVYKLISVSNNGRSKFRLDPYTGVLEVTSPLSEGEAYSLSIEAKDNGGLSSLAVLRINVRPRPNVHNPSFERYLYDVKVKESAPKFTSVIEAKAKDPENSPLTYEIIGGNDLQHFTIQESTGIIRVMKPLDRENITNYNMTLKATDLGGKFGLSSLQITVLDENDNDPKFLDLPYSFRVSEGAYKKLIGKVTATDVDKGQNGNVSYYLAQNMDSFSIGEKSGMIFTAKSLDFENQSVHYLVVGAKDGGYPARSVSTTATVLVQDISDEVPYFDLPYQNITVPENEPEIHIALIEAIDPDTEPSVTYRIISGDRNKFNIDPKTGNLSAPAGFDYEKGDFYKLTIGTEEGLVAGRFDGDAITTIEVYIQDRNDIPPHFDEVPYGQTLSIRDDVLLNEKIGGVRASDVSGSSPVDTIGFRLSHKGSSTNAGLYFNVDEENGDIFVIGDLKQDTSSEYQLEIEAYNTEIPTLSSFILIRVIIKRVDTFSSEMGLGFEKLNYKIGMFENVKKNTIIFTLPVVRKMKKKNVPFKCIVKFINSNSETEIPNVFLTRVNENKTCDLILNTDSIDREGNDHYDLQIELQSHPEFINPQRSTVNISLEILDVNDNRPKFADRQYFGILHLDSQPSTPIMQVQATDQDIGPNGDIHYSLQIKNNNILDFFEIHPTSGIITNSIRLSDLNTTVELPIHFQVVAEDEAASAPLKSFAYIVINVLDIDNNDLILTLPDVNLEEFENYRDNITEVLEDSTGYKIGIDKVDTVLTKYINGSCCTSMHGTDVYFHVIDQIQYRILNSSESQVEANVLSKAFDIKTEVSEKLKLRVSDLHIPYDQELERSEVINKVGVFGGIELFSYFSIVIGLGAALFVLATLAILYLFCAKRRLEAVMDRKEKTIVVPRYEPIYVENPQKEYETQVLQMNVPFGTEEFRAAQPEYTKEIDFPPEFSGDTQFFNMENVSYITKDDYQYG
ncbi:cadherin-99C isoform X2 [Lepeophtheirus salmonis]|uniref:cadherin-99C isoform X2 n=1 Tax=Lepeophtheirus salmonis TaxID=72036 RepID=UPI003AF3F4CC